MKKNNYLYFLLLHFTFLQQNYSIAQIFNTDCQTSKLVCGNSSLGANSNGSGFNDFSIPANDKGCLMGGENQTAWYSFRIQTGGTLTFVIRPENLSNDYDFAVWGPNVSCEGLGTPIRCNFSADVGHTGLSFTATETTVDDTGSVYVKYMTVQAGEMYYLLVDNYTSSNQGFALDWGGTATLSVLNASFNQTQNNCTNITFQNTSSTCENSATLAYLWNFGDGTSSTLENPTHQYASAGTYTVTLQATLQSNTINNNSTASYIKDITVASLSITPILNNAPDYICIDSSPIVLTATPTGGLFTINNINNNILDASAFNANDKINVKYIYTDINGCTQSVSKEVIVQGMLGDIEEETTVCLEDPFVLEALTLSEEQALVLQYGVLQYAWSNGATSRTIVLQEESDAKPYNIVVRSSAGCILHNISIDVFSKCNIRFALPTAFTPNGDGRNDQWEIFGSDVAKLDLRVYNRWGELVFVSNSMEKWWDGTVAGKPAPEGVYTWTVSYENPLKKGIVEKKEGSVTILR